MSEEKDRYDKGMIGGHGVGTRHNRRDYTISDVIGAIRTIQKLTAVSGTVDKAMSLFSAKGIDYSKMSFSNPSSMIRTLLSMRKGETEEDAIGQIDDLLEELDTHGAIKLSEIKEATTVMREYLQVTGGAKSLIKRMSQKAAVGSEEMDLLKGMLGIKEKKVVEEVEEEPVELTAEEKEEMKVIIAERKEDKA